MPRPQCGALLFIRLLLFRRHCGVIKCVSPCHRDLNLLNGFYCLIQTQVSLSWTLIKGKYLDDLIHHKSVSVAMSYFSVSVLAFSFHSLPPKVLFAGISLCFCEFSSGLFGIMGDGAVVFQQRADSSCMAGSVRAL